MNCQESSSISECPLVQVPLGHDDDDDEHDDAVSPARNPSICSLASTLSDEIRIIWQLDDAKDDETARTMCLCSSTVSVLSDDDDDDVSVSWCLDEDDEAIGGESPPATSYTLQTPAVTTVYLDDLFLLLLFLLVACIVFFGASASSVAAQHLSVGWTVRMHEFFGVAQRHASVPHTLSTPV